MPTTRIVSPRRAIIAVVLSLIAAVLLLFSLFAYAFWQDECRHNTNLKQLGLVFRLYAGEENDFYEYAPRLSSKPGNLMCEPEALYPQYVSEPRILLSLADSTARDAWGTDKTPEYWFEHSSYFYLGYMVWDDATVAAFADAYRKRIQQGLPFDTDLPARPPVTVLKRIDYGVYRQMVPEDQVDNPEWEYSKHSHAEIPLLIERPRPYPGKFGLYVFGPVTLSRPVVGGCILYMDGHTEFVPYPGKWPMTERTIDALEDIAAMRLSTSSRGLRDI